MLLSLKKRETSAELDSCSSNNSQRGGQSVGNLLDLALCFCAVCITPYLANFLWPQGIETVLSSGVVPFSSKTGRRSPVKGSYIPMRKPAAVTPDLSENEIRY